MLHYVTFSLKNLQQIRKSAFGIPLVWTLWNCYKWNISNLLKNWMSTGSPRKSTLKFRGRSQA